MKNIAIVGGSLVTATSADQKDILLTDGVISSIGSADTFGAVDERIDAQGCLIFPGLIDCHVHFREPGLEHKATMQSEAASALAGGVTTVCEMPNTDPTTSTVAALADKVRRAEEIPGFDMRFFFGITKPEHLVTLQELWTGTSDELVRLKERCCGVKIYLDHSTGNQKAGDDVIEDVFVACGELDIPLVAHCEDPVLNATAASRNSSTNVSAHSLMRPPESEERSIDFALNLALKHQTPFHVAHLSTKQGLLLIQKAKSQSPLISCEVAPHHLFLSTDDYERLGTLGKMNPPLRTKDHCEALFQGLNDRVIDCVATDHAPHTLEEKQSGEPLKAPSGVPGVETMLPLLLTHGVSPQVINGACFAQPNRIFRLHKSEIKKGVQTHLVVIDPHNTWTIQASTLHSHCGWTPFEGVQALGKVVRVI